MFRSLTLVAALVGAPLAAPKIILPASLSDLESRARKDSNDAAAHYNVALAYWNAKRYVDVDSALHRAIRIDPEFAAAYMALALLPYAKRPSLADDIREDRVSEEWKKPLEEADRMFRRAVMIDPLVEQRLADLLRPRHTLYLDYVKREFGEWLADYLEGFDLYRQGKYQDAYVRFQRVCFAINGSAHTKRLWNTLIDWHGLAAAQVNKNDDAVADFQMLLDRWLDTENSIRTRRSTYRSGRTSFATSLRSCSSGRDISTRRWRCSRRRTRTTSGFTPPTFGSPASRKQTGGGRSPSPNGGMRSTPIRTIRVCCLTSR